MNPTKFEVPISMRWKVSKEEIQRKLYGHGLYKKSKIAEFDIFYGLSLTQTENKVVISLGILMKEVPFINAKFNISIVASNNFYFIKEYRFKSGRMHGKTICSHEQFYAPSNNYFINDYIYFNLEAILYFEKEQKNFVKPEIKSPNNLGEFLWNRDDKDFDIVCDNGRRSIKVHKLVISAKSPVFDRMIQSGLKESKENKVFITDFDSEVVEIAIKFCYCISISDFLNVSNGIKLLQFFDKYDIPDLKNLMEEYLFNQKSPMHICEIVNASILSNSIKLREQCFDYLLECMKESIFINALDILDKEFSLNLLKASFCSLNA
uniref:BTB domain-containing protein n=1 Tax=Panagrolaimus sp. ES5 TaxID=591445 RepID=A0AC34G7F7_9BILA